METTSFSGSFFELFKGQLFLDTVHFLLVSAILWLPPLLIFTFWRLWITYKRRKFILTKPTVLLDVRLPAEINRSPKAMEAVFAGIHAGPGEATWWSKYVEGKVRPWWSFELVSIEGKIHFYIWTREEWRNNVEAQIYAQYPDVEIYEVDDYARQVSFDEERTSVWGCDFVLDAPDAYPIKTYVDYGLEREGIEADERVDPIASVLEFMSGLGKGEQLWYQIIIQQTKGRDRKVPGTFFKKTGWKTQAEEEVLKIQKESMKNVVTGEYSDFSNLSKGKSDIVSAIERSVLKHGFSCGMRGIYFAEKDKFRPHNISGMIAALKHYSSNNLNGFHPDDVIDYSYPWQDFKKIRQNRNIRNKLEAYRTRSWFHGKYKKPYFVLNTEELATIYHFPGQVVQARGLERITSRRGDAPTNLPT